MPSVDIKMKILKLFTCLSSARTLVPTRIVRNFSPLLPNNSTNTRTKKTSQTTINFNQISAVQTILALQNLIIKAFHSWLTTSPNKCCCNSQHLNEANQFQKHPPTIYRIDSNPSNLLTRLWWPLPESAITPALQAQKSKIKWVSYPRDSQFCHLLRVSTSERFYSSFKNNLKVNLFRACLNESLAVHLAFQTLPSWRCWTSPQEFS